MSSFSSRSFHNGVEELLFFDGSAWDECEESTVGEESHVPALHSSEDDVFEADVLNGNSGHSAFPAFSSGYDSPGEAESADGCCVQAVRVRSPAGGHGDGGCGCGGIGSGGLVFLCRVFLVPLVMPWLFVPLAALPLRSVGCLPRLVVGPSFVSVPCWLSVSMQWAPENVVT